MLENSDYQRGAGVWTASVTDANKRACLLSSDFCKLNILFLVAACYSVFTVMMVVMVITMVTMVMVMLSFRHWILLRAFARLSH
eukprot:SAG31_NODE_1551_length_7907_cov_29.930072_6_plen_84_part_00